MVATGRWLILTLLIGLLSTSLANADAPARGLDLYFIEVMGELQP